ncbi:MAG: tRNA (adenosine(37)-N6)-dimethylallyltransferase MiaA [Bacteroidales bacterium]|nr:tRNA (adenosine(37)-N6)-dimethylallyltransferase MiaA [Bacteroidales bacterium]
MTTSHQHSNFLIVVEGPTAVGKTSIAILLAQHFQTEIISADSRQFYRELKIGTAAPTIVELAVAPHHFVGHLSVHDYYNVSRFEQDVLHLLPQLFEQHQVVIMVGGSGLYLDAVCKGINDLPDIPEDLRNDLKQKWKNNGIEYLQKMLQQYDPEYFQQVDIHNHSRLIRALEVILVSGKTFSELRAVPTAQRPFQTIHLGLCLERQQLIDRIHHRVEMMLQNGLIDEVREQYPNKNLNALNTVGYKELFEWMDGKVSQEQAIENLKTNTRRYAKRQMTWFRRNEAITWFDPSDIDKIIHFCDRNFTENNYLCKKNI